MKDRTINFDPERGIRIKRMRHEYLKIEQKELAEQLDISSSKLSMIEKGQMPTQELINFLIEEKINLNWIYADIGDVYLPETDIDKLKNMELDYIMTTLEEEIPDHPFEVFLKQVQKISEYYFNIKKESDFSTNQQQKLVDALIQKITAKLKFLAD
jgi:transcriptional regulator with XRE-family HTH domain